MILVEGSLTLKNSCFLQVMILFFSCWKHKMESKLNERRPSDSNMNQFPAVFYPKRSKKLLHALANDISDVIRKTSTTANGGKEAKVVTYEDLIKDPQVMETMKTRLGLSTFFFYTFTSPGNYFSSVFTVLN